MAMTESKKYILAFLATLQGDKAVRKGLASMERQLKGVQKSMGMAGKTATKTSGAFAGMALRSAMVVPIWFAIRMAFMKFIAFVSSSVKFLVDWEYQMAQLRIVAKGSKNDYEALSLSLLALAKNYGLAFKELGEGAKLWAQQGKSIQEIIPLMDTTIKLSLLTGRSVKDSVEDLTAVMKSFGIEASETGQVVDKVTKVMLNHAITTDVMVQALKQVAPVAVQMGVSFEKLLGIITATHVATRQSGSRIGRAWRTIFSRMSTSAIQAIQTIAKVPVYLEEMADGSEKATFRQTNALRSMEQVLDEVALAWKYLKNEEQARLRTAIAGIRRGTEFSSAMNQYEEGLYATLDALDSYGEGQRAINILMDTSRKRLDQIGASWRLYLSELTAGGEVGKQWAGFWISFIEGLRTTTQYLKGRGGIYKELRKINDVREEQVEITQREVDRTQDLIKITETLLDRLETRNRLQARQDPQAKQQLADLNEIVKVFGERLAKEEGFEGLLEKPINEWIDFLKGKAPEIAEALLGDKARAQVEIQMQALEKTLQVGWRNVLKILDELPDLRIVSEGLFGTDAISSLLDFAKNLNPVTASAEDLEKVLNKISEIIPTWELYAEGGAKNMTKQLALAQGLEEVLKTIVNDQTKLTDLQKNGVAKKLEELKAFKKDVELRRTALKDTKERLAELTNLKNLGYSELEIVKRKLEYLQKTATAGKEISEQAIRQLEVKQKLLTISAEYERGLDVIGLITQKMTAEGYNQLEIESTKLALLNQLGAGTKTLHKQQLKILSTVIKTAKAERERVKTAYDAYATANVAERKKIQRALELSQEKDYYISWKYRTDPFDRSVIDKYLSYFSEKQKEVINKARHELFPELPEIPKIPDVFKDKFQMDEQVKQAFDVSIVHKFASNWESSMMASLERFREAWLTSFGEEKLISPPITEQIQKEKYQTPLIELPDGMWTNNPDELEKAMEKAYRGAPQLVPRAGFPEKKTMDVYIHLGEQTIKIKTDANMKDSQIVWANIKKRIPEIIEEIHKRPEFGDNIKMSGSGGE